MLVLTRKLKQQIQIGANITVTVLRVQGNSVRIGIEAPNDVRILRGELPVDAKADFADSLETDTSLIEAAPAPTNRLPRDFTNQPANPGERAKLSRSLPVGEALKRRRSPHASMSPMPPRNPVRGAMADLRGLAELRGLADLRGLLVHA